MWTFIDLLHKKVEKIWFYLRIPAGRITLMIDRRSWNAAELCVKPTCRQTDSAKICVKIHFQYCVNS
jgi:hypothetical protein